MKKILTILSVLFILMFSNIAFAKTTVYIDGEQLISKQEPFIKNGTTMIPFRVLFEKLGFDIKWNGNTKTITGTKDDLIIVLKIDSKIAKINDESKTLLLAPCEINGSTYVPLRFVGEASGKSVNAVSEDKFDKSKSGIWVVSSVEKKVITSTTKPNIWFQYNIEENSIGTPELHLKATNMGEKDIVAFQFKCKFIDTFDRIVYKTGTKNSIFQGIVQDTYLQSTNGLSDTASLVPYQCDYSFNLVLYDLAYEVYTKDLPIGDEILLTMVKFKDGSIWKAK